MATLPLAIPALAASLAYANARFGLVYDWNLLSSFIASSVTGLIHEKRDRLNVFYSLESRAQSSSHANHPFIIHHGRQWTYRQAYEVVLKYGTWLKQKGIRKDEVVAMDFMNSDVFIWVWFGLWSIGAKPAFINYNLAGTPLVHSVRTSTARLVMVDAEVRGSFTEDVVGELAREREGFEVVYFDQELEARIENMEGVREPGEARSGQVLNGMAMLIYTSGTTGLPKPAVMSWGKGKLGAKFVAGLLPLKKSDIMYTCMPLYHSSASVLAVIGTLNGGSTICIGRRFSHKTFWPEIRSSHATILHYVGETCRYLLSAPASPLDTQHNLRMAFGNGLRPDVWNSFKSRFNIPLIVEFYAATEAPGGTWNRSSNDFSAGAIGRNGALAALLLGSGLAVIRMDPDSEPPEPLRDPKTGLCQIADWEEPGELLYKLDPADLRKRFQGYFGNEKATNSKILRDVKSKGDAYFRTGDLVKWDRQHRWYFMDRIGDTFRWKAENVSTAEVADVLGQHPAVTEANVYGVLVPGHDGRAGCAAVVLHDSARKGTDTAEPGEHILKDLGEHVANKLPGFARPIWLRVTKGMQLTGTNKQQKHVLQKEGIEVEEVEKSGDRLFWLREGVYVRFGKQDLDRIRGGSVKL